MEIKSKHRLLSSPVVPVFGDVTQRSLSLICKERCVTATHQKWPRRRRPGAKGLYIKYTFLSNAAAGSWICYTNQCLCIPRPHSMLYDNKSTHWLPFEHSLHRYHLSRTKRNKHRVDIVTLWELTSTMKQACTARKECILFVK